jgi:bifunctional enzyme CysN/CysC
MSETDLIATDIEAYLERHQSKDLLRFITCGSVDDGKSTLIGRLLYESKLVFEDHLAALEADSVHLGTQGGDMDFALLVDGLSAEREQGITIDVAYRFFSTEKRKFIVADTPGHEQYTRNMVTGASTADLAVILVDARKGVLTQTRRHSFLDSLLGIRTVVLAINKLDMVDYSEETARSIEADYRAFAESIGLDEVVCIPISALKGDNLVVPSENMAWYDGPTLIGHLESVPIGRGAADGPFRMPVQWVNRPNLDFRGFSGTVVGGSIRPGDAVTILPSGISTTVSGIFGGTGELKSAECEQSVTLTLAEEVDVSRGDVIVATEQPATVADQIEAHVVWMGDEPLKVGRPYLLKVGAKTVGARVAKPKYRVDVNTLEHIASSDLTLNEIGVCNLSLDQPIAFDPYAENRDTGGFILIDRLSNATVAAGLVHFALRRSTNVKWQSVDVNREARSSLKSNRPGVVWLTGISGAGKSTIANLVERRLHVEGHHTYLLDGDNMRFGINKDLGFTEPDRIENIRRVSEIAALMADAGLLVIVAVISPLEADRQRARSLLGPDEFCEVFIDTSIEVAEARDIKGLYAKARLGEITNFTGIHSPYETPIEPEVHIVTKTTSPEEAAEMVIEKLRSLGRIS